MSQKSVLKARARVANLSKKGDSPALTEARLDLTEAKVERAIEEAFAASPPLTGERRQRLARLLLGGVPPMSQKSVPTACSRVANLTKKGDSPALTEARIDLNEAKLERAIRESLAATPALPEERRQRLARLLLGGGAK